VCLCNQKRKALFAHVDFANTLKGNSSVHVFKYFLKLQFYIAIFVKWWYNVQNGFEMQAIAMGGAL